MKKFLAGVLVLTQFIAPVAIAQEHVESKAFSTIGQEREQTLRRELAFLVAPIKTEADLREHLASSQFYASPLNRLSEAARQRFLSSLTFNENGLTGFRFVDLQEELSVTQIYQVLALFGAQDVTTLIKGARSISSMDKAISTMAEAQDYPGYACSARATCTRQVDAICMRGC